MKIKLGLLFGLIFGLLDVLIKLANLIPNIVNTVKGVAKQEQTVFGDIAEARTRYAGATTPDQKAQITFIIEVRDKKQLAAIIQKIASVDGVLRVKR